MLSNLLILVIIVCIQGIKATKRWFRESPADLGAVISASHSTSVPWREASIVWLLCSYEKKKNLSSISCFAADSLPIPKNSLFPHLIFIKIQKLLGGFKKYKN